MHNILLISNDVIGERMAGPGIRSWEFAKALSGSFQISLAVPKAVTLAAPEVARLTQPSH